MTDIERFSTDTPVRKADAETWARVREEYGEGLSPRLLAERHGLGERNIRRRAAAEGGPRLRPEAGEGFADGEALEAFDDARRLEVGELLLHPTRRTLSKFAFRRATEAAAFGRPAEGGRLAAPGRPAAPQRGCGGRARTDPRPRRHRPRRLSRSHPLRPRPGLTVSLPAVPAGVRPDSGAMPY